MKPWEGKEWKMVVEQMDYIFAESEYMKGYVKGYNAAITAARKALEKDWKEQEDSKYISMEEFVKGFNAHPDKDEEEDD